MCQSVRKFSLYASIIFNLYVNERLKALKLRQDIFILYANSQHFICLSARSIFKKLCYGFSLARLFAREQI